MEAHRINSDVTVLADTAGPRHRTPARQRVRLHAEQPVVIDTGSAHPTRTSSPSSAVIDPADVRWIWITHPDRDHTGGLWDLLEAAPQARLVTTFLGVGIMSTQWQVPLHRVHLVNPGESLDVGDRMLTGHRPPLFDNPATVGSRTRSSGAFFSSDCFGAPLSSADVAVGGDARAIGAGRASTAQLLWAAIDSPWVHLIDRSITAPTSRPSGTSTRLASSARTCHRPSDSTSRCSTRSSRPLDGPMFVGPDQAALEQLLATFEPV